MSVEKPYEIDHIPNHLHALFDGKVPPAVSGKTAQERENNFVSRSLAAFAVHKLSGCTPDEAAASLVDGGGDGGIDAVHYSPTSNTLWLVQSKFIENGRGEPELGERPAAGARREFYENARWLVLSLLFLREHLDQGETLALTDEEKARAAGQTLEIANTVWAAGGMKDDVVVVAKREAAVKWCEHATPYAMQHGGKPWKYVLIPHDMVAENMTLAGLVQAAGDY